MRKLIWPGFAVLAVLISLAPAVQAGSMGVVSTDRFGYTGTVQRFSTLGDAQGGTNQVGADTLISNRDLALFLVSETPAVYPDINIIMGSWWYSTEGSAGYGNIRGNSGVGFVQLYDEDSSTDLMQNYEFQSFDGTYWTEFSAKIIGANADVSNDGARFWVDFQGWGADAVFYHEYALEFVASGLEGTETTPGVIEALNHPTSVTGSYSGIFENVSTAYPANNGFYRFDLTLDMTNWAWENRADLDPYEFADSYFLASGSAVPLPAAAWSGLLMLAGLVGVRVRRRRVR